MIRLLQYVADLMNTPQSRGVFGEMIVSSIFDYRFFGEYEHYIVNDIILETPDGKTHQIDHVVIYRTGIFCIETKNIGGLIIGNQNQKMWKVYCGKEPYEIYNPIKQNIKHVAVLSEFIQWEHDVHSVIVFTKSNKPKDCGENVLNLEELKDYVKSYHFEKEITSDEMKRVFSSLTTYKKESNITTEAHVRSTKKSR